VQYAPRPDGPDEAGLLIRIDDGVAAPGTLLQRIGVDPKTRLLWEAVVTHASRFRGEDWGGAVRAWTDAGGEMRVLQASSAVGDAAATVDGGRLTVGSDGRLRGALELAVRQAPRSTADPARRAQGRQRSRLARRGGGAGARDRGARAHAAGVRGGRGDGRAGGAGPCA
jgi:hypothetical protein